MSLPTPSPWSGVPAVTGGAPYQAAPAGVPPVLINGVSPQVDAFERKLLQARENLQKVSKTSDGLLFNFVGLDGMLSAIPVVGGLYSTGMGFYIFSQTFAVRAPLMQKMMAAGMLVVDAIIGFFLIGPAGVVDLLFRSHAWIARRLIDHVDLQLSTIATVRAAIAAQPHAAAHLLQSLDDQLFRGGQTQQQAYVRLGIIGVACAGLLGYCMHQENLRQERILACEARGGWFCSWRN